MTPDPWAPDLTTDDGRRALEARVARAPAVLVDHDEALPVRLPQLVVSVIGVGAGALVALDHLVRPDAGARSVLRRRLALLRVEHPDDPAAEEAVFAWSVLAREHAELTHERERALARIKRLAGELGR